MSVQLRITLGPIILCDLELFALTPDPHEDDDTPQLNGGQGTLHYPDLDNATAFGYR